MVREKKSNSKLKQGSSGPLPVLSWLGILSPKVVMVYLSLVVVLVSGLSVVRTTHENRFAFNGLQELRDEANQLEVEWGQLLLEQSTFGVDGRIENKASQQLQMAIPDIDDIVMVGHER